MNPPYPNIRDGILTHRMGRHKGVSVPNADLEAACDFKSEREQALNKTKQMFFINTCPPGLPPSLQQRVSPAKITCTVIIFKTNINDNKPIKAHHSLKPQSVIKKHLKFYCPHCSGSRIFKNQAETLTTKWTERGREGGREGRETTILERVEGGQVPSHHNYQTLRRKKKVSYE